MATPNRLIHQSSPYLLQHAYNPVDWYPWGEEALQKAKTEHKPILVSIGYSACHWCHVMERESFENEQIAALMNTLFVCIKIDREERPDIDAIYMDALQAMGIRGGWPLNVFLLPDARPFYGLTYAPPQNWYKLLQSVRQAFDNQYEELEESAAGFTENMLIKDSDKYGLIPDKSEFEQAELDQMFEKLQTHFDTERGGMDRAPKFPMPSIYKFLLRYYALTKNSDALAHIQLSLNSIALGGIYDHVGGGWARYSVDEEWFIPHFEKMLYDNAQLLSIYAEAYTLFSNEPQNELNTRTTALYKQRIEQTVAWLTREMMSEAGGFYAALDADSEGVEGKFYTWNAIELQTILGDKYHDFAQLYNITEEGNWEHGYNHLHLFPDASSNWQLPDNETIEKLFAIREKRVRPGLDNKILASWNGLLLKGLTDVFRALGDEKYRSLATQIAQFLKTQMTINGNQLVHTFSPSTTPSSATPTSKMGATVNGFLEDYAAVIEGYIGLYEISFDEQWLDEALRLTAYVVENFYDPEDELFYFTDSNSEALIARKKEVFDNVIPASNSIMAHNLYWLGTVFDHEDYKRLAKLMVAKLRRPLLTDVQWATNWAALYALLAQPTAEIALVGTDIDSIRKQLETKHFPNKIVVGAVSSSDIPLLENRTAHLNPAHTLYLCYNKTCQMPVKTVEELWQQLQTS